MTTRTGTRTGSDRAALVARGWIECECGRTRRIPKDIEPIELDLYVGGLIASFMMPERAWSPEDPERHLCDPAWLREQVVALRATVAKRDQKIRELGIGMARLKARGDRPVAAPGKFRALRLAQQAQHRAFDEIVADVGPVTVTGLAGVFEDARKALEANPNLISSEGKSEIARLEATAGPFCACCAYFRSRPAGVKHEVNEDCTCVEGCPNA